MSPIPKAKRRQEDQRELGMGDAFGVAAERQRYDPTPVINALRRAVDAWRALPSSSWGVTAETARLLEHWHHHKFSDLL